MLPLARMGMPMLSVGVSLSVVVRRWESVQDGVVAGAEVMIAARQAHAASQVRRVEGRPWA